MQFKGILPEAISSLIWRDGCYDPKTTLKLINLLKKGDTFLDIGAHFGYFTLIGQSLVSFSGKVISIEPMPSTYSSLQQNIEHNGLTQYCTCVQKGAFNESKRTEFMDYGVVFSSLNGGFDPRTSYRNEGHGKPVQVDLETVDVILEQLDAGRIDVVKIDAESSEFYAVQGMMETVRKYLPSIIIEVDTADVIDNEKGLGAILALLEPLGYALFDLKDDKFIKVDEREIQEFGNLVLMVEDNKKQAEL